MQNNIIHNALSLLGNLITRKPGAYGALDPGSFIGGVNKAAEGGGSYEDKMKRLVQGYTMPMAEGGVTPLTQAQHALVGGIESLKSNNPAVVRNATETIRSQFSPTPNATFGKGDMAQEKILGDAPLARMVANKIKNGAMTVDDALKQYGDNLGLVQQISRRMNGQDLLADLDEKFAAGDHTAVVDIAKKILARPLNDANRAGIDPSTLLDYIKRFAK